jgi:predicted RNase H-like HicB family nuclease
LERAPDEAAAIDARIPDAVLSAGLGRSAGIMSRAMVSSRHRRYLILIEEAPGQNYSAHAPDLPGCVATGATREDCEREMRDAVAFHIEGLRAAGEAIPEPPQVSAAFVEIAL